MLYDVLYSLTSPGNLFKWYNKALRMGLTWEEPTSKLALSRLSLIFEEVVIHCFLRRQEISQIEITS